MNRKKRKLHYIRQKNKLRRGEKLIDVFKVSNSLSQDELIDIHNKSKHRLSNIYKLPLKSNVFSCDFIQDDFIKGIMTCKSVLSVDYA